MTRVWYSFLLAISSLSCSDEGGLPDEPTVLHKLVNDVARDMYDLGFLVDTSDLNIQVKNREEMVELFKEINEGSRSHVKGENLDESASRLAFYDPNTKTIVFQAHSLDKISAGYLAHELAHVYQDQKWGLENIWSSYREDPSREQFSIAQYTIEGHAELAREAFEQKQADSKKEVADLTVELGRMYENECLICDFKQAPENLPYSFGLRFLLHQYRNGGWPSVEELFEKLPRSSEQIIHPSKYKKDIPKILTLPEWKDNYAPSNLLQNGSMGEAFLITKLLSLGADRNDAFRSSSGWDGDTAQLYRTKDGDEVFVWRIAFDRELDALQLVNTLRNLNIGDQVKHSNGIVDWIITKNPILKKKLRAFMNKHPQHLSPIANDQQSTEMIEAKAKTKHWMYLNLSKKTKIALVPMDDE